MTTHDSYFSDRACPCACHSCHVARANSPKSEGSEVSRKIRNEEKLSEFLFGVQKLALRKGIPHRKIVEALATEHFFVQLISLAGALEFRKATFSEQQLAVAETIAQRFDYDERMRAEAKMLVSSCSTIQPDDNTETDATSI